jgi:hypothetical protein
MNIEWVPEKLRTHYRVIDPRADERRVAAELRPRTGHVVAVAATNPREESERLLELRASDEELESAWELEDREREMEGFDVQTREREEAA